MHAYLAHVFAAEALRLHFVIIVHRTLGYVTVIQLDPPAGLTAVVP